MYNEVQRLPRTKMVLPLRVWLDDRGTDASATHWAHTIDTSDIGCRIGGLRTELSPGQIIMLQRGQQKTRFRVIWSKQLEPHENQAGAEVLDHSVNIWSIVSQPNATATETAIPSRKAASAPRAASALSATSKASPANQATSADTKTPPAAAADHKSLFCAARRHLGWCLGVSIVLVSMGMGLYLYRQIFPDLGRLAIEPRVPAPPTAQDLERLTPKPHLLPVFLTKPLEPSASRMAVAEAPTGHIVYPVAPDDFTTGKVHLQILIAANGLVKQIHVLSGKEPLAEAAAAAVRLWHYSSFQGTDPASERETSVTVSFLGADAVSLEFPRAQSQSVENN